MSREDLRGIDPRIARRGREVGAARRRRAFAAGAALLIIGAAVWVALWSPALDVRRIEVVGAKRLAQSTIASSAGVGDGENLLLISTASIERRVERLPWVADAQVQRMLPGTLRVKIEERSGAAVLITRSGSWILDATGIVLGRGAPEGLPRVSAVSITRPIAGQPVASAAVINALRAVQGLPRDIAARVEEIEAPSVERTALVLSEGIVVRYGRAERIRAKNAVLRAVLARIQAEGRAVTYIDVRVPSAPAVAPVDPSPDPTPSDPSPTSSPS